MVKVLRASLRSALRAFGASVALPLVTALARRPNPPEEPVSVHLLVSSKTWRMGLLAALSLEFFSARRWRLFFHEDGSLDRFTREAIEKKLPGVRFVTRQEADAAFEDFYREFPACLRNRKRHNLFLKFFDPLIFAPSDKFIILDSDLFFYRRPDALIEWARGPQRTCHYNRDVKEVYSLPREKIEKALGVRLWESFNSGLVCISKEALNLQLSEKLLVAFENDADHPQFFEQTLYALNCSAHNQGGPLPPEYEITWNIFRSRNSICRHYVGPAKFDHLYFEGPVTLLWKMILSPTLPKNSYN
jgi:hypothetical protein